MPPSRHCLRGPSGPQTRLRLLLGLLSRPEIGNNEVARLRRLLAHPHWRPVPRIPSVNLLEPLYAHHLSRLEIGISTVFQEPDSKVLPPPNFVDLMRLWSMRRRELNDIARMVENSSLDRAMLFKGAALAPLYPAPALRQMVDLDLVVSPSQVGPLRDQLSRQGWSQAMTPFSETWSRSGALLTIDLHVAQEPLARRILDASLPAMDVYPGACKLTSPQPTDHLLLVALHAADNGGNRIWRDVCDAQALLIHGADAHGALDRARGTKAHAPVEAMLAFMARWCGNTALPRDPASREGRRLLSLLEVASIQSSSPVQLELLGSMLFDAPMSLLGRLTRRNKSAASRHATAVERDPILGTLPSHGSPDRVRVRLAMLKEMACSGRLPRVALLAFRQARSRKNRRLFETPRA